jgi:hypothetical protein
VEISKNVKYINKDVTIYPNLEFLASSSIVEVKLDS